MENEAIIYYCNYRKFLPFSTRYITGPELLNSHIRKPKKAKCPRDRDFTSNTPKQLIKCINSNNL